MSARARRPMLTNTTDRDEKNGEPEEATQIREIAISESYRVRLIGDLSKLICEGDVPEAMRSAGLALIGYLARRFPGEQAHDLGVEEARRALASREEASFELRVSRTEIRTRRRR
jgi:hypothetical protein